MALISNPQTLRELHHDFGQVDAGRQALPAVTESELLRQWHLVEHSKLFEVQPHEAGLAPRI